MPFSFTQIEKDKSSRIGFVFCFLIVFYFIVALLLYWATKVYFLLEIERHNSSLGIFGFGLSLKEILNTLGIAFVVGLAHWFISTNNIITKILTVIQAKPLDLSDTYHKRFQNIIDEVSVACGGMKFEGVVISTTAMNAFALADFSGRSVIGMTEGLLTRLNRAQLETVVAHEVAHILKGDCLETTVTTSLFDLYKGLMSNIKDGLDSTRRGKIAGLLLVGYLVLQVTYFISHLFRMFISREREYRADAIAVRLTRDPLSLAESLYMISRRWRGYGIPGDGLEAIFIIAPQYQQLDEGEGLFSNLFSTHPPIESRLSILLDMAHSNVQQLEDKFKGQDKVQQQAPDPSPAPLPAQLSTIAPVVDQSILGSSSQWEVYNMGEWKGPYSIVQLRNLGWVEYDAFVRKVGDNKITRLFETQDIKEFNATPSFDGKASPACPLCKTNLYEDNYKGSLILRCQNCAGILLYEDDVQKILSRDDYFFSEKVKVIAEGLLQSQQNLQVKAIDLKTANLLSCPRCKDSQAHMLRNFYTLAYPIEIDRCLVCKSIWFDRTELEVLQYMVGKNLDRNDKS